MRTMRHNIGSQRLINDIQLARLKVAQAESRWELADEQAREARRRRKEAKRAARRAKKQARQAKEEFAGAKQALVALEGKFAAAVERAVRNRKLARDRLAAARRHPKTGSADSLVRAKKLPQPKPADAAARAPERTLPATGRPPAGKEQAAAARRSSSRRAKPTATTAAPAAGKENPVIVPRDFETPPPGTAGFLPAGQPPLNPESRPSSRL